MGPLRLPQPSLKNRGNKAWGDWGWGPLQKAAGRGSLWGMLRCPKPSQLGAVQPAAS